MNTFAFMNKLHNSFTEKCPLTQSLKFHPLCPQYLEKKIIRKVEVVLRNYNQIAPEFNKMEDMVKQTLEKEKKK